MKTLLIAFALICAVSAARRPSYKRDVSHLSVENTVQTEGQGWYKSDTGYVYPAPPATRLDVEAEVVEPEVPEPEPEQLELAVENVPADAPVVEAEYLPPVQADYLPPKEEELKEYLPPSLRKRAVRRIYRRIK